MEPTQIEVKPPKKSSKASRFVAKLSPKKFQRKREITKIATMKVNKLLTNNYLNLINLTYVILLN